jgi:hypothetical protein
LEGSTHSTSSIEVKCKICDTWYELRTEEEICPQCSFPARARIKEDPPLVESENPFSLDLNKSLLPIRAGDHFLLIAYKKLINFLFLIYLLIMAMISWMAVTFSG